MSRSFTKNPEPSRHPLRALVKNPGLFLKRTTCTWSFQHVLQDLAAAEIWVCMEPGLKFRIFPGAPPQHAIKTPRGQWGGGLKIFTGAPL